MSTITFRLEIEKLINRESMEGGSNTPDFILADYLVQCLQNFDRFVNIRDSWYGRETTPKPPETTRTSSVKP